MGYMPQNAARLLIVPVMAPLPTVVSRSHRQSAHMHVISSCIESSAPVASLSPRHPPRKAFPTWQYRPIDQPTTLALPLVFSFNGGALSYFGMQILAALVTTLFGICFPWVVVMKYRWRANHTTVNGAQLRFTGSGAGALRSLDHVAASEHHHSWDLVLLGCSLHDQVDRRVPAGEHSPACRFRAADDLALAASHLTTGAPAVPCPDHSRAGAGLMC